MDREDVYRRVVETTERFGAGNPQQLKLLCSQFAEVRPAQLLAGLLLVISRSDPAKPHYQQQELAGRLLEKLRPKDPVDLAQCLRAVLPAYNPSIEQIPQYLAAHCGKEAVIQELLRIECEHPDSRVGASSRTMRWWLGH